MNANTNTISVLFRANLAKYEDGQLTRELACAVVDQTLAQCATPASTATATASGSKKESAVPDQWTRILNSKEYGVCAYPPFRAVYEEMKKAQQGLNYFVAISLIRTQYEGKPEWQGYLSWVRERHPHKEAVSKDPSPRKPASAAGGVVSAPALTALPAVPTLPAVPAVPTVPVVPTVPAVLAVPEGF